MSKLRHVGIVVTNMEKSLGLYRDCFGFDVIWDEIEEGSFIDNLLDMENVKVRTVKMKDESGGVIELLQYYSHLGQNDKSLISKIGCSHLALTVKDLDLLYENLTQQGIKFNYPVQTSSDGNVKVAFCSDPDGTWIELVEELA